MTNVYTLEELRSISLDKLVGGIVSFARIIQASANPTEDYAEDSCEELADDVLWKIKHLFEAVRGGQDGSVNPDLVAIIALKVGQLDERLTWMVKHGETTRKGIQRKDHEQRAQRKGVEALRRNRRRNIQKVAALVKKVFTPDQQGILTDAALARHLAGMGHSDLGGNRVLRDYIAQARKEGLISARQEK
jgi:hypothetical protein